LIVDFHSHTHESDGTLAPQALADFMRDRSVAYYSITDHDTLSAYGRFEPPAHARVISGVEINTSFNHNEVHVLGYNVRVDSPDLLEYGLQIVRVDSPDLQAVLERNRGARRIRIVRMVEQLREAGYDITQADVEAEAAGGDVLGRPHVGKALLRKGLIPDIDSAFRSLLRRGGAGYVPNAHIQPHEAIAAIQNAGGIAVLAHPGRLHDYAIIDELAACGLRGLEVFYPSHEPAQVQHFRDRAKALGLVMTAGSDFHDIRYHKRGVGMEVETADIAPFLEMVA